VSFPIRFGNRCRSYRGAMANQQLWERSVGGLFLQPKRSFWPNFFSRIVARLQWNPAAIDRTQDARAAGAPG
jgi:hypothetical protein